ncbi:MAG: hypothetical protein CVV21_11120, partial [Candidatus Goldiibacteriota bacterium HGW-Goldbacteria-1]
MFKTGAVTGALLERSRLACITRVFIFLCAFCAVFAGVSNGAENYTAYDPAGKVYIYRSFDETGEVVGGSKREINNGNARVSETTIKPSELQKLAGRKGAPKGHENYREASVKVRKLKDTLYRAELSGKKDGQWYRMKVPVPKGYRVRKILRDDGVEIINDESDIKWYLDKGHVYFYDDPVSGYSVVLSPPQPNFSIMVEEPLQSAGQMSAIIYPYNGEADVINGIDLYDHLGRSGDNGFGQDFSTDSGAKLALRYTYGGNTFQYGNPSTSVTRDFTHTSTTYTHLNNTPWGETEAVISTVFQTTVGGTELPFLVNKKTIIRGNRKWFATIYYITNNGPGTAVNVRFFQGCDWSLNGSENGNDCSFDAANDTMLGYNSSGSVISYGGFSGFLSSAAHQASNQNQLWLKIRQAALTNSNSFSGKASTALEWNLGAIQAGQRSVAEIIWGYGNTLNGQAQTDMQNEIDYGKGKLHDTGILALTSPADGRAYQNSDGYVMITGTAVNYGLRDWTDLPVRISITGPAGFNPVDSTFTAVNLIVPTSEQAEAGCRFDISTVPAGEYTIKMYTNLAGDTGIADMNTNNDSKTVKIIVGGLSVNPQTSQVVSVGQHGDIDLTASNTSGADSNFDISISSHTKSWPTYILNGSDSVQIAGDTNGDGTWDYVNPAYDSNGNGKPDIHINNGDDYHIVFRKQVSGTAESGETDITKLLFTGINFPFVSCEVSEETTAAYKDAVNKTLWLHGPVQSPAVHIRSLTTLTDTAAAGGAQGVSYTMVPRYTGVTFALSPELYRGLRITQDIPITLILSTGGVSMNGTAYLFYTNGFNSALIGTAAFNNINRADGAQIVYTRNVNITAPVEIPAGYKVVLRFENTGNNDSHFNIYHNSTERSNLAVYTTEYVGVDWIKSYDAAGNTKDAHASGGTVRFAAQVSDPFGAYDVAGANIIIYNPSGVTVSAYAAMDYDSQGTGYKVFYNDFVIPPAGPEGVWHAYVEGVEGNQAKSGRSYYFSVSAPDHIRLYPQSKNLPAGEPFMMSAQVVDINGNSMAVVQAITVTMNNNAYFVSVPVGWSAPGGNMVYGNTDLSGYAEFYVNDMEAEPVTVTPQSALAGSQAFPDRDEKTYLIFLPPHHISARADDGIAVMGAAGTGEPIRIYLEDVEGNTIGAARHVTVTAGAGGYFDSVPAGWGGAGTGIVYGQTNLSGYADLVLKSSVTGIITVTPDSSAWGAPFYDESTEVRFVAAGADHVVIEDSAGGTLTAGAQKPLTLKVVDGDGLTVIGAHSVSVACSGNATFTASTLTGVSGIGTGLITGQTDILTGEASFTVINYTAESVTVSPDSSYAGSVSMPDRDENIVLTWLPGNADHIRALSTQEYVEIGALVTINLYVVDRYENRVNSAEAISVNVSGAAMFISSTLSGVSGLNTASVTGTTDASGFGTVSVYNESAQTNIIVPGSTTLIGSNAVPDRDISDTVVFTSDLPTPTITVTFTISPTVTITSTSTPTRTITRTVTLTATPTPTQEDKTPTPTVTSSVTPSVTGTNTQTVTQTTTQTVTASVTETVTRTNTETITETVTQTVTETATRTATETITETATQTVTET